MNAIRVEQLATDAGVSVATIRYYQSRGLLDPPRRDGRVAWYDRHHTERLTSIRDLATQGFSLAQISRLLAAGGGVPDPLHDALLSSQLRASFDRDGLDRDGIAERSGLPRPAVDLLVGAGLVTPVAGIEGERFDDGAVAMLDAAATVGRAGLPIDRLLDLALRHERHIRQLVDDAVRLVHEHATSAGTSREELAGIIEGLVPAASTLVADHFRRALLDRAMLEVRPDERLTVRIIELADIDGSPSPDGLDLFRRAEAPDTWRVLWHHPERDVTLSATGTAAILDAATPATAGRTAEPVVMGDDARFVQAAAALDDLRDRLVVEAEPGSPAPTLVGGFAFADAASSGTDARWAPLGEGALILPAIAVLQRHGRTWLQIAGPHDQPAQLDDLADRARDLLSPRPAASTHLAASTQGADSTQGAPTSEPGDLTPRSDPAVDQAYEHLVAAGLRVIRAGRADKLVLARAIELTGSTDVTNVLDRLRHANPNCVTFAFGYGSTCFLGATPELLVDARDGVIATTAVAGTRSRGTDPATDRAAADTLRHSAKDRAEHQFVVDQLTSSMAEAGVAVAPTGPTDVVSFAAVHHLVTPLVGHAELGAGGLVRLVGRLHPSPAVGGSPTDVATRWLAEHEGLDRGWYAAPIGVLDIEGNGEFWVALRSALVHDDGVVAFVGAGVVEGSQPADELDETTAKFATVASALGLP